MSIGTFIGNATEWGKPGRKTSDADYRVEYEGCVLQEFERNGYDDSDFMAIVWDEAEQTIKTICWGTTRGWTYANYCRVDATPEVIAKAQACRHASNVAYAIYEAKARSVLPGKAKVVAVKGNGKNGTAPRRWKGEVIEAGSEGTVTWVGTDSYNSSRWHTAYRLGVKLDDGRTVFGPADAFEVVNPEQYELTEAEVIDRMPAAKSIRNFHVGTPGFINMVA